MLGYNTPIDFGLNGSMVKVTGVKHVKFVYCQYIPKSHVKFFSVQYFVNYLSQRFQLPKDFNLLE